MPIQDALRELEIYSREFAAVGDAKEAIKNDKDSFIHKWSMVMKYFNYISDNTQPLSLETRAAMQSLFRISRANPSLDEWVQRIISPSKFENKGNKTQTNTPTNTPTKTFNVSNLYSQIDYLVSDLNRGISWDSNKADNVVQQLNEFKARIEANKASIDANQYRRIMNDINVEIYRINRKKQDLYEIAESAGRGL